MTLKVGPHVLLIAVVGGLCLCLATGFVENTLFERSMIPEIKYYGHPLVWRVADPFTGERYDYLKLLIDCIFWIAILLAAALLVTMLVRK